MLVIWMGYTRHVPLSIKAWKADKPYMGKCDKFLAEASADIIENAKHKDIELGELSYL